MTIPTIGRIVIVLGLRSKGATDAPAIITRVGSCMSTALGPAAVNLTAFPDMAPPCSLGCVLLFHTAEQARAFQAGRIDMLAAHWPEPQAPQGWACRSAPAGPVAANGKGVGVRPDGVTFVPSPSPTEAVAQPPSLTPSELEAVLHSLREEVSAQLRASELRLVQLLRDRGVL